MAQIFSELTINTRASPLSLDADSNRPRGGLRAGDRALDASVVLQFTSLQLYTLIYRGCWTLLVFSGCGSYKASAKMHALLSEVHSRRPDLAGYDVSTEVLTEPETANTLFDLDEAAHRVYIVDRPTIFLIRPDGHVGVRVSPLHVEMLHGYLDRWLPDASQSFSAACI